ncbi:hypothetical protein RFI_33991, partial [Reticulomyxa filosa]
MIFLIEIPSTLDHSDFTLSLETFFSTVKFPIVHVSPQNNEFEFGKEAQYVIKWLQEFFNGNLKCSEKKQRDIDPDTILDLEKDKMRKFMENHFDEIAKSKPIHQCSFFKYLYQQLRPLVQPKLKKQFLEINAKSIQWRHEITKSVIETAKILCCCQYNYIKQNVEEKEQKIESTGQEEFYLCKKWHDSKECCFLVNQDGESISVLVNNMKNMNQKQLDEFQKLKFHLFDWQQDLKKRESILQIYIFTFPMIQKKLKKEKMEQPESQNEKEKRLRLLFRILGIPTQGTMKECEEKKLETTQDLHEQIVNKLRNDKEWSDY